MSLTTFINDAVNSFVRRKSNGSEPTHGFPDVSSAPPDTRRLIRDRRYCHLLAQQVDLPWDEVSVICAWKALEYDMALVPGGEVSLVCDTAIATHAGFELATSQSELVPVESILLDRHCVTNADYAKFVDEGGYTNPQNWPEGVLPNVLQFVDSTGRPGPSGWVDGQPPQERSDHPVVGVCWYEASAYASWAGKRLPTTAEWQRAGTWPQGPQAGGSELRYPWGNAFDPNKANTWAGGAGNTQPVHRGSGGETPNGVSQLIGNVWEWVDAQFSPSAASGVSVRLDQAMAEIRGGAFDTYFASHATCQFRTGQPLIFRGPNVGFRCCISAGELPTPTFISNGLDSTTADQ